MTFEQLIIFVATAERQHLTQAANALRLTPSAVSASIKALETFYAVKLFDRVGRGIQLTREGRVLLKEAKETLARVKETESVLAELGKLNTGSLDVQASQTIANYWLPSRLLGFSASYPGIQLNMTIGNTATVAAAVINGDAELGFIEGALDEPLLSTATITSDKLVVVSKAGAVQQDDALTSLKWIMREQGSGTRSVLEQALKEQAIDPHALDIRFVLPSNEALLTAVLQGGCVTALSQMIVSPFLENGQLQVLDFDLPPRRFTLLRHKERHRTAVAREFEAYCHVHA
ncbi:DNA-binding transcriptional LysR family regulator [Rhizobium sp. BIGb0125]|uniref:LysR substrate-binding domain-containing protein n=1 Tax=Rhizobium sp. BIGb0125 TaxID=2940618 RepID=UPI00216A6CEB|nr:LysR substrate-binding domain-containing protein [Rhizobium sp. BIGb0125]MCS4242713.1 DNA-binding transcriptional LysR family regulator [Rhizobium sp. BIGb0125]